MTKTHHLYKCTTS